MGEEGKGEGGREGGRLLRPKQPCVQFLCANAVYVVRLFYFYFSVMASILNQEAAHWLLTKASLPDGYLRVSGK